MKPFVIPQLQEKFEILIQRGGFKDKTEIAQALGRSVKTLNWWAHGDNARVPGQIPNEHVDQVIKLFMRCYPADTPNSRIIASLNGSYVRFASDVTASWTLSWTELVERYAKTDRGRVELETGDLNIVEMSSSQKNHGIKIYLGQHFRILFEPDLKEAAHLYACQEAGGITVPLPAGFGKDSNRIISPPVGDEDDPVYMIENNDVGSHRFIVLHSIKPFHEPLHNIFQERRQIDQDKLKALAVYLSELPQSAWRIYAITLSVTPRKDA